jgi:hypothetical protein
MEDEVAVDVSPDLLQRAEGVIDLEVLLLVPRGCHAQQRVEVPIIEAKRVSAAAATQSTPNRCAHVEKTKERKRDER